MRVLAPLLDLVTVLVFVGIGRSVHTNGVDLSGVASTAWPFLVGLGVAWFATIAMRRSPAAWRSGIGIGIVTVACGMFLRVLAGQGTAVAFVLVALGFLGGIMTGWRVLVAAVVVPALARRARQR